MTPIERPILFSGEMVQAILQGRKTQTRRVMKPQPELRPGTMLTPTRKRIDTAYFHWKDEWWWQDPQPSLLAKCPYGKPGDRLWVRETWGIYSESWTDYGWEGDGIVDLPSYKALPHGSMNSKYHVVYKADGYEADEGERWRPSIFMPRWASRITLEVTGVKVERVQDITDDDAIEEGVDRTNTSIPTYARQRFHKLWDSINGTRPGCSWAHSPWVWCVSFKRVTP